MASVFETRIIGNIGKDAVIKPMDRGIIAINFPVAHNKNWRDKKTGSNKTKTTWVNCTLWKREGSNLRIVDFLLRGTLVELIGTPYAKGFAAEDGTIKSEIRLNVTGINILRAVHRTEDFQEDIVDHEELTAFNEGSFEDFTMHEEDF
jgi:single-stranded DNA-binding protein